MYSEIPSNCPQSLSSKPPLSSQVPSRTSPEPPVQGTEAGREPGDSCCSLSPPGASRIEGSSTLALSSPRLICSHQPMSNVSRYSELHQSAQQRESSSSRLYPCLIPGCRRYFTRTDYRCNHLKRKHRLPIPKGCWAHTWISKVGNQYHYLVAAMEQEMENDILILNAAGAGN